MKWVGGAAFVSAFTMAVFSAGAAAADCKSTCNTHYADCGKSSRSQQQCLSTWMSCKTQCSGGTARMTPVTSAAQPKGGVVQKATVKH